MPTVRPCRGDGYLFPPPPKHNEKIYCLVVEKKGDETKTSMRQSEIYAYSNDIIIRDGYMVMPKIWWNSFEPGDWFTCYREYSVDRYGQQKEERELVDPQKIERTDFREYNIPYTKFENGYVKILCPFVLCPSFIRNKETRNSYGSYKKLYLMNIGQGFVHNRLENLFRRLQPERVYTGIFEFRAKDNGAVNFGHRSEVRDQTGHVMERDAMWELISIDSRNQGVPVSQHIEMKEDLDDLFTWALRYEEDINARGAYGPPPSRHVKEVSMMPPPVQEPPPVPDYTIVKPLKQVHKTGNPRADQLVRELNQNPIQRQQKCTPPEASISMACTSTITGAPTDAVEGRDGNIHPDDNFIDTRRDDETMSVSQVFFREEQRRFARPQEVIITNLEQLEAHRARVIMRASFQDSHNGGLVHKWIDRETNETSTTDDILNYKFDVRHGLHDNPPFGVAIALEMTQQRRQRTLSEASFINNVTAAERPPLASSTPLGSPEQRRRRLPPSNIPGNVAAAARPPFRSPEPPRRRLPPSNIPGNGPADITIGRRERAELYRHNRTLRNDDTDVTETLFEMRRDNNANPIGSRRRPGFRG